MPMESLFTKLTEWVISHQLELFELSLAMAFTAITVNMLTKTIERKAGKNPAPAILGITKTVRFAIWILSSIASLQIIFNFGIADIPNLLSNSSHSTQTKFFRLITIVLFTFIFAKLVTKGLHHILDTSNLPNVTLFINVVKFGIWTFAALMILQVVFDINPAAMFTALGVGGIAVGFGLKDTLANIISGFGLMAAHVISPGDFIRINNMEGIVRDLNWRHTLVVNRDGNELRIPNSVLNTAALEKLTPANEALVKMPFTLRSDIDAEEAIAKMRQITAKTVKTISIPGTKPLIRLTGFDAYGITGEISLFPRRDIPQKIAVSKTAHALAGHGFFASETNRENESPSEVFEL